MPGGQPTSAARQHHHNSGQMGALLNPTHGVRDEMRRRGVTPKNHQSEHFRRLRQMNDDVRAKRTAAEGKDADNSPEQKNGKYTHVGSVVARQLTEKPSPRARPATAPPKSSATGHFVVGRVAEDKPVFLSTPFEEPEVPRTRKPPVPRRGEAAPSTPRAGAGSKDFVSENIKRVVEPRPRTAASPRVGAKPAAPPPFRSPEQAVLPPEPVSHHPDFGSLPGYLVQRKLELALAREKKQRDEEERRICPPGMRLVPEAERQETLSQLQQSSAGVLRELQRMPLVADTLSQKKKRSQLEAKARDLNDAMTTYSRNKVVVQREG